MKIQIHIPRGLSARETNALIRQAKYRENFLRAMRGFTIYFNALEKAHWQRQNIQYRTEAAREAENQFLAAKK